MKHCFGKRICALLAFALSLTVLFSAMGETNLYLGGADKNSAEYKLFTQNHPELTVDTETNIYLSTDEIISAFLTGEFPFDTFVMTSSSFDLKRMFSKGYCSPLSSSAVLTEKLSEMYEPIQRLLTHDGNIYGAPFHCYVGYYTYCPDAWAEAGLTAEDVPTSFVEYLDFLEAWAERIRDNPEDDISVSNTFDSEQYGEHSYISYLVDRLITNHIMQCNYAGEPLRFDTPLFRELLERCQSIGTDLYLYEPEQKADLALFEDLYGMRELKHLVPLRLTSDQPVLIKATLYTAFLNVRSQHQALATEYLEDCVTCIAPEFGAYLYRDAEPVEDPEFVRSMEAVQKEIQTLEQRLAASENMEPLERNSLSSQLEQKKKDFEAMAVSEQRYLISENDLNLYRTYGENLYFQPPSIFDPSTEEGQNVKQLRDRFCTGSLTMEQFIGQLDQLAWILEMEDRHF